MPNPVDNYELNKLGIDLLIEIYSSTNSRVYKGIKKEDQSKVIVKIYNSDSFSPLLLAQFKNEYQIIKKLNHTNIIKIYDIIESVDGFALIIEDINGISFDGYLNTVGFLNFESFFNYSIQICQALQKIHSENIIHRDLKPANFILDTENKIIKIADFGISTDETQLNKQTNNAGTLSYISPEQTGRINRSADYRTDFYSLGIVFYKMLVGELPFITDDPLEIIHSHMAKPPPKAHHARPEVPEILSLIIEKLMAKMPEDRYQSSKGLQSDLELCLKHWKAEKKFPLFKLGQSDYSLQLKISQKFYGREKELQLLETSYEQIKVGKMQVLFLKGDSGVGKSSLIQEIRKSLLKDHGIFISGKYDQYKIDTVLMGFSEALQLLISHILSQEFDTVEKYKKEILNNLKGQGGVITPFIENLTKLIGEQERPIALSIEEEEKRFFNVFSDFIQAIAISNEPIFMFLDDLQWADTSSLKLLAHLMSSSKCKHMLIVASYRANEVNEVHPLFTLKKSFLSEENNLVEIALEPIGQSDIEKMLADTLRKTTLECKELALAIFKKTEGNPYFVQLFLKDLYEKKLLYLNDELEWTWHSVEINNLPVSENIKDLLVARLNELPIETKNLLGIAGCIGFHFDFDTLVKITKEPKELIYQKLLPALQGHFIVNKNNDFYFQHDRVQESVIDLITENSKTELHYLVGKYLYDESRLNNELRDQNIFSIVQHFNLSTTKFQTTEEKTELAALNLQAGIKAQNAFVHKNAIYFLNKSLDLLGNNAWNIFYDKTIEIHKRLNRSLMAMGRFEKSEELLNKALTNITCKEDMAEIQIEKMLLYTFQSRYKESIQVGTLTLKEFGIHLNENPSMISILIKVLMVQNSIKNRTIESILNIPKITIRTDHIVIRLLNEMTAPAFVTGSNLVPILITEIIKKSLELGNTDYSAFGFSALIAINMMIFRDYGFCQKLIEIATELNKKYPDPFIKAKVSYMNFVFTKYYKHSAKSLRNDLVILMDECIHSGEKFFGNFTSVVGVEYLIYFSNDVKDSSSVIGHWDGYMQKAGSKTLKLSFDLAKNVFSDLIGHNPIELKLDGQKLNEELFITAELEKKNYAELYMYLSIKSLHTYILGNYDQCFKYLNSAKICLQKVKGALQEVSIQIVIGLNYAAWSYDADSKGKKLALKNIKAVLLWLDKLDKESETNYHSIFLLLKAEVARLENKKELAANLFDESIQFAQKYKWPFFIALANESTSRFYFNENRKKIALVYLEDAKKIFFKWGSPTKVEQLNQKYSKISHLSFELQHQTTPFEISITSEPSTFSSFEDTNKLEQKDSSSYFNNKIDFISVLKASRIISKEVSLSKLLSQVMNIMMKNAGAQKGYFILNEEHTNLSLAQKEKNINLDNWKIVADAKLVNSELEINVLQKISLADDFPLPKFLFNYIIRTEENIVLENASTSTFFEKESYFKSHQILSVLALPIENQGRMVGILYLENNLNEAVFTKDRVEILSILANQASISLDTSRLYENLEAQVEQKTKDMKILLDNVQYGIITFGADLNINEEYSLLSLELFNKKNISNMSLNELLFQNSQLNEKIISTLLSFLSHSFGQSKEYFEQNKLKLPLEIFRNKGQQILQLEWLPIVNKESKVYNIMLTVKDITAIKIIETKLFEASKMAAIGRMAGGIAHEINTPLTIIKLQGSLLLKNSATGSVSAELVAKSVNKINSILDRITQITQGLRIVARDERLSEKEVKSLSYIIESTLPICQERIHNLNIKFDLIELDKDLFVFVNQIELSQVILNILNNAIDAIEELEVKVIKIVIEKQKDIVAIKFSDSGLISTEIADKIMEPFFTTKSVGKGTRLSNFSGSVAI